MEKFNWNFQVEKKKCIPFNLIHIGRDGRGGGGSADKWK